MWTLGGELSSGLVFVLSGPSAVGKDTVTSLLKAGGFPLGFCVTATTRLPRPGEVHGKHYYFLSESEFEELKRNDGLLEFANVHGNQYGIPASEVRNVLKRGEDVLLTVDPQGARTLRRVLSDPILIFLMPPSVEELIPRLMKRGAESGEQFELRLRNARHEMEQARDYDYQIVNYRDQERESAEILKAIIIAERHRVRPRLSSLR